MHDASCVVRRCVKRLDNLSVCRTKYNTLENAIDDVRDDEAQTHTHTRVYTFFGDATTVPLCLAFFVSLAIHASNVERRVVHSRIERSHNGRKQPFH